jgi:hypothetical protein
MSSAFGNVSLPENLARLQAHLDFIESNPMFCALKEVHSFYTSILESLFVKRESYSVFLEQLVFDGHSIAIVQSLSDSIAETWHKDSLPAVSIQDATVAVLASILHSLQPDIVAPEAHHNPDFVALFTIPLTDRCVTALSIIERILESLRDHFLSFSVPCLTKQVIVDLLHPICSDLSYPIDFRLGLLRILEISQLLVTSDKLKKLFYKVEAIALKVFLCLVLFVLIVVGMGPPCGAFKRRISAGASHARHAASRSVLVNGADPCSHCHFGCFLPFCERQ